MQTLFKRSLLPMLLVLPMLLSACASSSPPLPPVVVPPAEIPPLPAQARQPTIPSDCLPTCSAKLMIDFNTWRNTLTGPETQGSPASGPTTH